MGKPSRVSRKKAEAADRKRKTHLPAVPLSMTVVEKICDAIAAGASLVEACRQPGTPDPRSFGRWRRENPEVQQRYAHACQDRADVLAMEVVRLADTADNENHNAIRLKIDARKWAAGKMHSKAWGDRKPVDISVGDPDGPGMPDAITINIIRFSDQEGQWVGSDGSRDYPANTTPKTIEARAKELRHTGRPLNGKYQEWD